MCKIFKTLLVNLYRTALNKNNVVEIKSKKEVRKDKISSPLLPDPNNDIDNYLESEEFKIVITK